MNKLYIGNEQTIYSLTSGKEIVLTNLELEELLQSYDEYHELKIENKRYEDREKDYRYDISLLHTKIKIIGYVERIINEFNNHPFSANSKVIYKDKEYEVLSVNFEEKLIQLQNEDWVRCESCQII
ncbi:hypothetical protein CKA55_07370 [Arcobacter suis]|uniref:Uncharacterized protein n=1 Tax=Arcobacter suis CECT 7833 TaxID=663365 RepID=A0AAD0SQW2_9BACT|nr:hypothetical protein [Arcobacter suis]AXX89315.1 hypothetical protein ASUIS_0824 [Arcobacter suis CECT 7833]RWS46549.1 hypothetical protein CKA55_07370 [Arcobacter suis]